MMFTGIVEAQGVVHSLDLSDNGGARLTIVCPEFLRSVSAQGSVRLGDSISVAGVCLTISALMKDGQSLQGFSADLMPETLRHTRLADLAPGELVNLEPALLATGRLGGHIVQGHVDGVATLRKRRTTDRWDELELAIDPELGKYIAHKGSIALDGVSLTVASRAEGSFGVALIPATLQATTLGTLAIGGRVNVEVDVLAKYVESFGAGGALESARRVIGQDDDGPQSGYSTLADAVSALRQGEPILVADDETREDEVDIVLAAQFATAENLAWIVRHTSGYVCAPMPIERAEVLELPLMVTDSQDSRRTAYTVSVDAAQGITTGISAADRATTLRVLADPSTTASDLIRPGHILPLRAVSGGVEERSGHTESAVRLCELADLQPVAVIAELIRTDGAMMRRCEAVEFARRNSVAIITVSQLVDAKSYSDLAPPVDVAGSPHLERRAGHPHSTPALLPTAHGDFSAYTFSDSRGTDHLVVTRDSGADLSITVPLVRVHSECLTGDALGSKRCDCGPQLDEALRRIAADPQGGAVIYLRGHEGRGIGLAAKLSAYALQDQGLDTVDANLALGHPVDSRDYVAAAEALRAIGWTRIRLLSNNPAKAASLRSQGIDVVEVVPHHAGRAAQNEGYVRTKIARMGHVAPLGATPWREDS